MNKIVITVTLIVIIVAAIGAYAYIQNTQQPQPSPSPKPTTSPYPTASPTPSATPSSTETPTPSQSPTQSPSPSTSPTPAPSASPTPSPTRTPTPTSTPTPTPTATPAPTPTPSPTTLIISSTTSLYETGVENDEIKPAFQAKYPWITVNFLAQGTGAAIQTAMRGDADMIMVHDPAQESTFMSNGYGVNRKIIAYNFFIIVGPQNDPAGITGLSPVDALKRIYTLGQSGQAIWVSRGDGSGTNSKEKNLWKAADINWTQIRTETSWYKETGQGMTQTLLVADQLGGYTLSDTASYLTNTNQGNIHMKIVVQAHKDLLNVYSVIADNPLNANLTNTNFVASMLFMQYMVSDEGQQLLANYGTTTYGQPLFSPFVPLATAGSNVTLLSWIQNYAYIPPNATECPAAYRYNASDLYSPSYDALSSATSAVTMNPLHYLTPNGNQQLLADFGRTVTVGQPLFNTHAIIVTRESNTEASHKSKL